MERANIVSHCQEKPPSFSSGIELVLKLPDLPNDGVEIRCGSENHLLRFDIIGFPLLESLRLGNHLERSPLEVFVFDPTVIEKNSAMIDDAFKKSRIRHRPF